MTILYILLIAILIAVVEYDRIRPMISPQDLSNLEAVAERVADGGPHEWGYRDPVVGGFISDDWPFRVADALPLLIAAARELEAVKGAYGESVTAIAALIVRAQAAEEAPSKALAQIEGLNLQIVDHLSAIGELEGELTSALAERDALKAEKDGLKNTLLDEQQAREDHLQHVSRFLSEMYATLVDPCATGAIGVETMTTELLAAATSQRQSLETAEARNAALVAWSYDLSRIPNEPVEVAFDGGLGMCNIRICSAKLIGPAYVHNGYPVDSASRERGFYEEANPTLNIAGNGWRPYAWRTIEIPPLAASLLHGAM